jgi:glycosyltransferase involved in cell wall biosynthesis
VVELAGTGPLVADIHRAIAEGLPIHHLGQLSGNTKSAALTRCRAVVVPSTWWEPLGLVTYKAYDHAKSVLAAASGGLQETVFSGKNA